LTIVKNLSFGENRLIVLAGGPAAAFETASILEECPNVDAVVKGKRGVTFTEIVEILNVTHGEPKANTLAALSRLPGVCGRGRPAVNDADIPILPKEAFASLPFQDLSASPVSIYRASDAKRFPMVTMMPQCGCIAKCAFCNTPQIHESAIRGWSSERIAAELKKVKAQHGIFHFSLSATYHQLAGRSSKTL
jgi:radical SAM superfamily enzyme YgiQ (UPF0313 family)